MRNRKNILGFTAAFTFGIFASAMPFPVYAAAPEPAVYASYTFSDKLENDVSEGGITFYSDMTLEPVEPSSETYNLSWISQGMGDYAVYRTEKGGAACVFSTEFFRPNRTDRPTTDGFICFDAGSITSENKSLNFEIEYFDEGSGDLIFMYVNGSVTGSFGKAAFPKTGTDTWKTYSGTVQDAHFNGSASTGLCDGSCDFRIESNKKGAYIRKITLYSCTKEELSELNSDADGLTPLFDAEAEIEDDFSLPLSGENGSQISWSSSSSAVSINGSEAKIQQAPAPTPVTLTATLEKNNRYITKSFDITIAAARYQAKALTIGKESWSQSNGMQTLSVDVTNADLASGTCTLLLVAYDKTSGAISGITSDSHILGAESSFTLSAQTEYSDSLDYSCYVWNGERMSLKNAPPAPVIMPRFSTKNRMLSLEWDNAYDDFDAISEYAVIVNGKEVSRVSANPDAAQAVNSYIIKDVQEDTEYTISVIAYDHAGLASEAAEIKASLLKMASNNLADCTSNENGISFVLNENVGSGDSYSVEAERDGVICRQNVNRRPINNLSLTYLYFSVDKSIVSSDTREVTVEVDYYDEGVGNLLIQYNADDGAIAKQAVLAPLTNTKTWKRAVLHITDAAFTSPVALTNSDFRIFGSGSTDGEVFVSRVAAIPTELY